MPQLVLILGKNEIGFIWDVFLGLNLKLPSQAFYKPLNHLIGFKKWCILLAIGLIKVIKAKFTIQIMTDRQSGCIFEVTVVKKHYFHCSPGLI